MRIADVRLGEAPIASNMRNSVISFRDMTCSTVALVTDVMRDGKPVVGYGFSSNGRYAATSLLRERFLKRVLNARPADLLNDAGDNFDPFRIWAVAMRDEKPGGHGERSVAVGALDMAVWDAVAKIGRVPLWRHLATLFGTNANTRVFVYAAGGYYHDTADPIASLREEMGRYLAGGYTHVKMKIGGATLDEDLRRIEAVVATVGQGDRVAVDANARFDVGQAMRYANALAPFGLTWYEEPCDPLDFESLARIAEIYPRPIATGENLFSMPDARNLIRYGGLRSDRDLLQFDCSLSYGLVEYSRILTVLSDAGWSWRQVIPHGGHQLSLHMAAGLGLGGNESYPSLFQPFGGFADNAPIRDGYIEVGEDPGIGIESKPKLHEYLRSSLGVT